MFSYFQCKKKIPDKRVFSEEKNSYKKLCFSEHHVVRPQKEFVQMNTYRSRASAHGECFRLGSMILGLNVLLISVPNTNSRSFRVTK